CMQKRWQVYLAPTKTGSGVCAASRNVWPCSGLLADVGQDAAVHIQDVAVDKVAGVAGQEHRRRAQVLGLAPAVGRGLGADEAVKWMHAAIGLLFAQGRGLRGSNVARSNAVALDVVL